MGNINNECVHTWNLGGVVVAYTTAVLQVSRPNQMFVRSTTLAFTVQAYFEATWCIICPKYLFFLN